MPKNNTGASIGIVICFVFVAIASQFNVELGAGNIPIPDAYRWVIPIVSAGIAAFISGVTPYFSRTEMRTGARKIHTPPDAPVKK